MDNAATNMNDKDKEDSELIEMLGNEGSAMSAVKKVQH